MARPGDTRGGGRRPRGPRVSLGRPARAAYNRPVPALPFLLAAAGAYLMGSLPTGYLVARARGVDIRRVGSGNIGATNVFRILGTPAGVFVLLVDAGKGALAVLSLPRLVPALAAGADPSWLALVAALGAVLGHNYTCWLGFRGGKGIATSAGVLAALVPWAFLLVLATFLVTLAATRYVSLASVLAAAVLPFAVAGTPPGSKPLVVLTAALALLAIARHRANLQRLLAGTENRLGSRKTEGGR